MSKTSEPTITITKTDFIKALNEVNEEISRHAIPFMILPGSYISALIVQKLFDKDDLQIVKENES